MIHLSILLCAKLALSPESLTLDWQCVLSGLLSAFVFPCIISLTMEIGHKDVADVVSMLRGSASAVECLQPRLRSLLAEQWTQMRDS